VTRPLIIGEAPNRGGDPRHPIEGRIGRRLAALSGLSFEAFKDRCARVNLLPAWAGRAGKGSAFSVVVARYRAQSLRRRFVAGRTVILLGHRVARAFGISAAYFSEVHVEAARVVVVPHPSGVNRWYNEVRNARKMAAFMRRVVRGRGGEAGGCA